MQALMISFQNLMQNYCSALSNRAFLPSFKQLSVGYFTAVECMSVQLSSRLSLASQPVLSSQ